VAVAAAAFDAFLGTMKPCPLTTSQKEENSALSRWESDGGNGGKLQAARTNNGQLIIPNFVSTEQAIRWGSHLSAEQHSALVEAQRALSKDALAEHDLQRMVNLATQSQLLREAAEAFVSHENDAT
jgi:hypothetical protein